jgi:signal transduction histidine kinase
MALNYFHVQTVVVLLNLTLGYVVWTYNARSYLNRILTLIIVCVLLIHVSLLLNLRVDELPFQMPTIVSGSLGISFFPPLLYTLSLYYPVKRRFKSSSLYVLFGIALVLSGLIIATFPREYIANKLELSSRIREVSLGELPLLFLIQYFLLTSYSVLLLVLATRSFLLSLKGEIIPFERVTVRLLVTVGLPLAYLLSLASVMTYFFIVPFTWVGILLAVFTAFVVVLVFRFHLVDLKRLINGILFFPALIAILVFVYIFFIVRNQGLIARALSLPESITLILEVFIIYLGVSTLRRGLNFTWLRRLFSGVLSSAQSDTEPLEYLAYARTLQELDLRLRTAFSTYYHVEGAALLLRDREENRFRPADPRRGGPVLHGSGELAGVLAELDRGVTVEELLILMNHRQELARLHEAGFNLVIPVMRRGDITALILVPRRGLLQRWSGEDIAALNFMRTTLPSLIDRCAMYENEKELEKHQYRMEQLMVMAQMASGLAHEIRNPLSIISTSVETIMRDGVCEKDRNKMLRYIQEEAGRINVLANKLLSIKFQKKPELEHVDLDRLMERLKVFLKYKLKDGNVELRAEPGRPSTLYTDPTILFQALLNLVLNAIEALPEGGTVTVSSTTDGASCSICVQDDGPGIPPNIRSHIFEPFFTTKKQGSGLGLTITRNLIESLFGSIELITSDREACFRVTLPLRRAAPVQGREP